MRHYLLLRLTLLVWLIAWPTVSRADITQNWGTVATPLTSPVTFSFAQYDITRNFTDQYNFSLQGGTGASYSVTFAFDPCRLGCGNPDLSYGIYDRNGSLVASTNGSVTLSAGNYAFVVRGTGWGAGNSVDYWGSVTFAAASTQQSLTTVTMVSPAPEPSTWLLMLCGMAGLAWTAWRRRDADAWGVPA
jgi:hypothetical protein